MTSDKIAADGWHLDDNKLAEHFEPTQLSNCNTLLKFLPDTDLKEIGKRCIDVEKLKHTDGPILYFPSVLQLQRLRNVSITKHDEDQGQSGGSDVVLRLALTDGQSTVSAIVDCGSLRGVSTNTPPGTKVRLKKKPVMERGFLLLSNENCEILGGRVEQLVEKWKLARDMEQKKRATSSAPKWVTFGKKIEKVVETSKTAPMNAPSSSDKPEEMSEFEKARLKTIAESRQARESSTSDHHHADTNLVAQKIAQREQAKQEQHAKKMAMSTPKAPAASRSPPPSTLSRGRGGRRGRGRDDEDENGPVGNADGDRPSDRLTLGDFLGSQMNNLSVTNKASQNRQSSAPVNGGRGGYTERDSGYAAGGSGGSREFRGGRGGSTNYRGGSAARGARGGRSAGTGRRIGSTEYRSGGEFTEFRASRGGGSTTEYRGRGGGRGPGGNVGGRSRGGNQRGNRDTQRGGGGGGRDQPGQCHQYTPGQETTSRYQPQAFSFPPLAPTVAHGPVVYPGARCLARHPQDGQYYDAIVQGIVSNTHASVLIVPLNACLNLAMSDLLLA